MLGNKKQKVLIYLALTIAAVLVILPLMWLFFTSFKSRADLAKNTWGLPKIWEYSNYIIAWTGSRIPTYMWTSNGDSDPADGRSGDTGKLCGIPVSVQGK